MSSSPIMNLGMHFHIPYSILDLGVGAPLESVAEAYCRKLSQHNHCMNCKRLVDMAYLMISTNSARRSNNNHNTLQNSSKLKSMKSKIEVTLNVNLDQVYAREKTYVHYERYETCRECNGIQTSGWDREGINLLDLISQYNSCASCIKTTPIEFDLLACKGCKNEGVCLTSATYELNLGQYSAYNKFVMVKGEGHRIGNDPQHWGDLQIRVNIQKHHKIHRNGFNLYTEMNISVTQLLCDQIIYLPYLNHTTLRIQTPMGISGYLQPGKWFVIKGKGLLNPSSPNISGDLHIKFTLEYPDPSWFTQVNGDHLKRLLNQVFSQTNTQSDLTIPPHTFSALGKRSLLAVPHEYHQSTPDFKHTKH
ncbi:hypothetical protein CONCODRAFT_80287 [Conidiobolus coronatus NRRL 28638]|uniref:Chaperone DnaJ C-terminal domain-containing protein n=1 Tax=Conidiobolus coronatus (strain ATCC 28846 / CBS 209.66 / NRRL 28638) TaxID=796925 RepID=A0A137NW72_CONC2|nr:hypothetical protein CONCODRAFT_80287 [Conidiobolus coronatus NRRL 28638]|eukprot:KXN67085.1 hypothetical protein CONCODRAFT_80287 [Conidiobolus coronatus NRRL 28638]